ncbi:Glycosyl hydrolases family 43 [Mucilaginibacter pineti]|uniref:Glycosyl hydrolases family 43 n=1 Tax=Mucilaginibacter pineti TaxID=1391627 RepID=A0A1G6ZL39_9SPHI|nr:glycoside hydrolase family 43 protein [Mucilaginibacter pineti]SDE03123.1 Glycosyl hydrolases family 43 [Mucilaginibacter pineti]
MKKLLLIFILTGLINAGYAQAGRDTIKLADPTIFYENHVYYLYGTGNPDGFGVYTSDDMQHWKLHDKPALLKGSSYGRQGFWAPQVFKHHSSYYMAYTADEHIAIASSDSPLGPFVQHIHHPVSEPGKQIDPFIFRDTDGKFYLYHVRLGRGNRIYVARLKDDLSDIDSTTLTECIHAEQGWENTASSDWPVSEGPTVTKIGGLYYLFYSANDFRNIDYAVGYATATSPYGPWTKYTGNPILSRKNTGQNGSGHGDVFATANGAWYYVFHTHSSSSIVGKRKTAVVKLSISGKNPAVISVISGTFRYLETGP